MSLDYRTTVSIQKAFPDENNSLHHKLQSAIFYTIPVGIGEITDSNVTEFYSRVEIWQKVIGAMFFKLSDDDHEPEPVYLSFQDCLNLVDLRTNASRKTRKQFIDDIFLQMKESI
jgi:hypothetical protein